MINFYNQVPSVYTSASRDFQYLSWLINIVLNSVKHNVDDLYNLPNTKSDIKLTELLAMTLGFKVKRNYDEKQLTALVAVLPSILKYKGTKKALEIAAKALVKAAGSLGESRVDEYDGTSVKVTLPKDLTDIKLFLDLLDYILPAGMTCRIVPKNTIKKDIDDVRIKHSDTINLMVADDYTNASADSYTAILSGLYEFKHMPDFISNIKKVGELNVLNAGLLDNTVIPVLADSSIIEVGDNPSTWALYSTETDGTSKAILTTGKIQLRAKKATQEL